MKFVVIPELKGRWLWELRGTDDPLISKSRVSYATKAEAMAAINLVKSKIGRAGVYDLVGSKLDGEA